MLWASMRTSHIISAVCRERICFGSFLSEEVRFRPHRLRCSAVLCTDEVWLQSHGFLGDICLFHMESQFFHQSFIIEWFPRPAFRFFPEACFCDYCVVRTGGDFSTSSVRNCRSIRSSFGEALFDPDLSKPPMILQSLGWQVLMVPGNPSWCLTNTRYEQDVANRRSAILSRVRTSIPCWPGRLLVVYRLDGLLCAVKLSMKGRLECRPGELSRMIFRKIGSIPSSRGIVNRMSTCLRELTADISMVTWRIGGSGATISVMLS